MKKASFQYETKKSSVFNIIKRPMAEVDFWSADKKIWLKYNMIVDTGADYTILPMKSASDLGIDVEKECNQYLTRGVGGTEKVYFLTKKMKIKIDQLALRIPIGFLERDDIPPLLGRHKCLNALDVNFAKFITTFREFKK